MRTFQVMYYMEENDSIQLFSICTEYNVRNKKQLINNIEAFMKELEHLPSHHLISYRVEEYKDGRLQTVDSLCSQFRSKIYS